MNPVLEKLLECRDNIGLDIAWQVKNSIAQEVERLNSRAINEQVKDIILNDPQPARGG